MTAEPYATLGLLYYATKAIGFIDDKTNSTNTGKGLHRNEQGHFYWVDKNGIHLWDPSEDDGDSRRLEVALRLDTQHEFFEDDRMCVFSGLPPEYPDQVEFYEDDAYAATRRAVLRIAAEIGKYRMNKLQVAITTAADGKLSVKVINPSGFTIFEGYGYAQEADVMDALRLTGMISQKDKDSGFYIRYPNKECP